ncbi:MAG: biotin/lipoyl-binding protein [Oscillospiraceae bacterium]|nr:biotin/lipoyl-binding protein [Oscillospiraceae bacterium]
MKKRELSGLCALLLSPALLFTGCSHQTAAADNSKAATAQITRGDLVLGLSTDGKVALPVSNLNFGVTGEISEIYVSVGDTVKAGDLLAELDSSSYLFAIESANNNLNKSQTAYNNAVSQYNYSVLSDKSEMDKLRRDINNGFDDYVYQTAIDDARTALERKEEELKKAKAKATEPFDSYVYNNHIEDAKRNLKNKQNEFDEAKNQLSGDFDDYTYQNAINEASINLERKKAALKETEKNSKTQSNRTLDDAQEKYDRKSQEYYDALYGYDIAIYNLGSTEKEILEAHKKVTTAKNELDDAQKELERIREDGKSATTSNSESAAVKSAKQAVEDAEQQLKKARTDLLRAACENDESIKSAYNKAKDALEEAEAALERAQLDKTHAKKQAEDDSKEKLENAKLAFTDAKVNLEKALTNLQRARADYDSKSADNLIDLQLKELSADMNKNSNATIATAEFALQEAGLNTLEANNDLENAKLYAPIDGRILSISQGVGETVSSQNNNSQLPMAFGTSGSGNSFITLCDVSQIYLTANITEGDIIGISEGQTIQVTVDAVSGEVFYGKVVNVDSIPTTDSNGITTYTVTCLLDDTSDVIKDGMNAYITFVKKELNDVLLVPNKAVFIEDGSQYVNVVKEDGSYEKRKVVCGLSNGVLTEVTEGLEAGETVLSGRGDR